MKLHERVFDLFASLNQGQPGRFELITPVRKIALDLSGGQVLGVDGVPELLTDLTELRGLKLSGRLSQDLNVALTQGVSYETAAYAAADNLGRLLVHLLGHPHVETRFKQAPPSPGAWPLPRSLVHILRDALRRERDPDTLATRYEAFMDRRIERTRVDSEPFALDPVALRTLGAVRSRQSLGELLLHSGRGVPARTRQALLAIDLLLHLGLLALRTPEEVAAEASSTTSEDKTRKLRLKKRRRRSAQDGERPRKRTRKTPPSALEVATRERELWYGVDDLTPAQEDEDDPFGLFASTSGDRVTEPARTGRAGSFIWAEDGRSMDAWAARIAEKTVAVPEVSLEELKHLSRRFRTMNPLEVLGLEPGDTVSVATVREAFQQRFAQFDPGVWESKGDAARGLAIQARGYVSAAYRKVRTVEGIETYAARWRDQHRAAADAPRRFAREGADDEASEGSDSGDDDLA